MPQLRQRLRLDLPDPLTSHPKLPTHLLQRPRVAIRQPKPQLNNLLLPLTQRMQHRIQLLLQQNETRRIYRNDRIRVLNEITKMRVGFLADRRLQTHRLLRHLQDLPYLLILELHLPPDLLRSRLPTKILQQLPLDTNQLVDRLHHVHRNPDRPRLIRNRPRDRRPNPPGRIRGELETLGVVELLHRTDQPEVPLLDQVQQEHSPTHVASGDGDDQAQVGLDELLLGQLTLPLDPLELPDANGAAGRPVELGGGGLTLLDRLGEDDLLLGGQQRDLADLLEVHPHRVVGRRLQRQLLVAGRARELLGIELVHHLDDLDVLVLQHLVDGVDLLGGGVDGRERVENVLGREEPALFAL